MVNDVNCTFADSALFGPLMLAVFLVKSLSAAPDMSVRKLGAKAFQMNVFQNFLQQLSIDPYAGNTVVDENFCPMMSNRR